MAGAVYALNLFEIANRAEYLAYSRRSPKEVARFGGKVVALGKFREAVTGDVQPRTVMIVVEWPSKEAFDGYRNAIRRSIPACTLGPINRIAGITIK